MFKHKEECNKLCGSCHFTQLSECVCFQPKIKKGVVFVLLLTGRLVSGDCKKNIHVWEPREGGTSWQVDQRAFSSHSKSVEDLQWSPTEATVSLFRKQGLSVTEVL